MSCHIPRFEGADRIALNHTIDILEKTMCNDPIDLVNGMVNLSLQSAVKFLVLLLFLKAMFVTRTCTSKALIS